VTRQPPEVIFLVPLRARLVCALLFAAGCQCGTKPIYDQLSSSFEMNRDSLPFPNFVTGYEASVLDVDAMRRMFGDQVCVSGSEPCQLTSAARTFMESANAQMSGGRCEGFAVLSDLMASKKVDVSRFGAATARELTLDDNPALQRELAYWFATQLVPAAVGTKTKTSMAKDVLQVLADSFEEGASEHYRIGIVRKQGKSISGGHSLTPLGFYRDPKLAGVYWLRVYDNNHPGIERLMKIDVLKNRWEFEASTDPETPSRLYFGDASNNNPIYLAPIFSRQGVLPCPFCEGGGTQVVTGGGAQPSISTPGGIVGVTDGELSTSSGTSITPTFTDPNDSEATSFVIGLTEQTTSQMGQQIVVTMTMPPDPLNPDSFQSVGVLQNTVFTLARGLTVTSTDTLTVTREGGTYANASRTPIELLTRIPTPMGEVAVTAFVTGGSDSVKANIDPATGQLNLEVAGATGVPVTVLVRGTTESGMTRTAQFAFTATGTANLQAETRMWMQGGQLSGTLDNNGITITVTNACTDGLRSGQETDVDCGAACNVGCGIGKTCGVDADCGSGICHPTRRLCITDACQDTRQSPGETGVDCGGPCAPCAVGGACQGSADCAEPALNDCVGGTCRRVFTIGAAVSLPPGVGATTPLVLANGGDQLTVASPGSYVFRSRVVGPYSVSIVSQPLDAECTLSNATGLATADVFVDVSCVRRFTIGGFLSGLPAGESVTVSNNGASPLALSQDGAFVFPLQPPGSYAVTVTAQPMSATCVVTNGSGPAPTTDIMTISVGCASTPLYSVGGTITGLGTGKSVGLANDGDMLSRSMNGAFTFAMQTSGPYDVIVTSQPQGQFCTVAMGTGTAAANVTTVVVTCADLFTIGGTLSGLGAGKTISLDNNGERLPLMMNGSFQFTTGVAGPYNVTIAMQPMGQTCVVANGSGTATGNVTTVSVACPGAQGRDATFGTNGFLRVAQTADLDAWHALVVNPDNSIVLAGFTEAVTGSNQWIVSKVTAVGAIDTGFGVNGHRLISAGTGLEQAEAILRDSMGRYVVVGSLQGAMNLDLGVARLTSAGDLDTTFGTNGVARFDFGGDEFGEDVAIDSLGRIVVAGQQAGMTGEEMMVARLTTAGALDMTFGSSGRFVSTTSQNENLLGVAIDGADRIVAVGFSDQDSLVLRLTSAGALDTTFNATGVLIVDLTTGLYADRLNAVALDGTRLVAAGEGLDSAGSNFYLAGFTQAGALDTSFGAGGVTAVGGATQNEVLTSLVRTPGGGWYAAGFSDGNAAVLRFSASGALDTTFGTAGEFLDSYSGTAAAFGLGLDSLGRVLIAGPFSVGTNLPDLGIARINP
jgi:uncharacterized delta-60 repeat protein